MNAELKKKWLEALRSGKYRQGKHKLRNHNNEFCCLGVLCDVADNTKWREGFGCYFYESSTNISPEYLLNNNYIAFLWPMNDLYGQSFLEIADYIEQNIPDNEG